ncbi:hypothetical protein SAMN02745136_00506 [Anaerocolumna jejuensis DSM 15929]|uniref:Uncharacterized protein n=1 Tax=Anaerocolumna jejuensis DSM 15929 TaxID=1121322 RepID=A0A1M6KME2_9FIRM|nr:hypothetical protein [Anaerocolumna jejuensis]SHJ60119.1 hypothetical protein SAMN02745136_00506 [Anaerocolumna jejuensis DSM 15929]
MEIVPDMAKLKEIELDILQAKELLTVSESNEWLLSESVVFLLELGSKVVIYADLQGQEFKEQIDNRVSKIKEMMEQRGYAECIGYLGSAFDYVLLVVRGYL